MKPRPACTSVRAFCVRVSSARAATVYGEFATWTFTVPPPLSITTATASSVTRRASPARSAWSGPARRQSLPLRSSTRPWPVLISVIMPTVSVDCAAATPAARTRTSTATHGPSRTSWLSGVQQLEELDRLGLALHVHGAPLADTHAALHRRQRRARDEDLRAQLAVHRLDPRHRVH